MGFKMDDFSLGLNPGEDKKIFVSKREVIPESMS